MTALTLVIGNKNYSSWSLRAWFFLKQNNIPFLEKRVPLFTPITNAELSPYNSDFKVPILQDGKEIIWDSLAIMEYLSEEVLQGHGWPEETYARAFARSVSAEMHSSFSHVRSTLPMNCRKTFTHVAFTTETLREIERITSLWRSCRLRYGSDDGWLFDRFTIADAMYAPIALRFHGYGVPLDSIEKNYVDHILSQPCIKEWIAESMSETEIIEEDEVFA